MHEQQETAADRRAVEPVRGGQATPRRSTERAIACTIDLGWRVAALYAMTASLPRGEAQALPDDVLPTHEHLAPPDRLAVEVRAAAGDADHAGVALSRDDLRELVDLAEAAPTGPEAEGAFRRRVAEWHGSLEQELWCRQEARGKAYELGSFLSDTWNRAAPSGERPCETLQRLFATERVERIKHLLDDLQARLDPTGAEVVRQHLDRWSARLGQATGDDWIAGDPTVDGRLEPLRRQTIIWRQLLTGDKEPEAFIDRDDRARVRSDLTRNVWHRYRRRAWLLIPIGALGGLVGWLLASDTGLAAALAGVIGSVAGALGITRASIGLAVRNAVQSWSELMWNRSLTTVIRDTTLTVDDLVVAPSAGEPHAAGDVARHGARRVRRMRAGPA